MLFVIDKTLSKFFQFVTIPIFFYAVVLFFAVKIATWRKGYPSFESLRIAVNGNPW